MLIQFIPKRSLHFLFLSVFEPVSPCADLGSFEDTQACLDEFEPVFHCDEPGPVMEVQASLVGAPCSPPWPVTPPVSEFSPLAPGPPRTSQREKGVPGRANRSLDWRVSQHHPVRVVRPLSHNSPPANPQLGTYAPDPPDRNNPCASRRRPRVVLASGQVLAPSTDLVALAVSGSEVFDC